MKKIIQTISRTLLLSAVISVSFTSCLKESAFAGIENDIATEASIITGAITSIARYTVSNNSGEEVEYLLLSSGGDASKKTKDNEDKTLYLPGLKYKPAESEGHGKWKTFTDFPFELHHFDYYDAGGHPKHIGQQILKVLADSDTIYLVTVEYETDDDNGITVPKSSGFHVWANKLTLNSSNELVKSGEWVEIAAGKQPGSESAYDFFPVYQTSSSSYSYTNFNVFGTNSMQKEHRKVYLRTGKLVDKTFEYIYYELKGTNKLTEADRLSNIISVDNKNSNDIDSVAYYNNDYHFFDSIAVTTNETKDTDPSVVYYGRSEDSCRNKDKLNFAHVTTNELYYFETANVENEDFKPIKVKSDFSGKISALALTKDSLLIGRANYENDSSNTSGIAKVNIDAKDCPDKIGSFQTNANIQLSSLYQIYTLLSVYSKEETEEDGIFYATIGFKGTGSSSSVSYDNIGLWSYYPSRGNWNRE